MDNSEQKGAKHLTTVLEEIKIPEAKAKTICLNSFWLNQGELRLDASFYAEERQKADRLLSQSRYSMTTVKELSKDVFNPPPTKRFFSGKTGTPYLTPSEVFQLQLKPSRFVFANKIENVEDWFVKKDWVLITQSGNVGLPIFVTAPLEKFVISQNFIRIVPQDDTYSGYVYAFLASWIGHSLITCDQFGVTVEHIRPHHLSSIMVPRIPDNIQEQIHINIVKVYECRDRARTLLENAEQKLVYELKLPPLKDFSKETKAFDVKTSKLNLRFDASYHSPVVDFIIDKLKATGKSVVKLGKVADVHIPNRLKRVYVKEEYGLPFLQTSDLNQIRPRLLKYLSRKVTKNLEHWVIHKGWVLLPCSGTMGRRMGKASLTPSKWDGWAATQHIARIIPHKLDSNGNETINEGYLTCFLSNVYGYQQIVAKTYGGVVDELSEDDIRDIMIAKPSPEIQACIGDLVVEAYELQELARAIEDETIRTLEYLLVEHKKGQNINKKDIEAYLESLELISNEDFQKSKNELVSEKTVTLEEFKKEHGF
jgi:type I restriction enzyme S subunit